MLKENNPLTLVQLENGMVVPSMNGRFFCSRRDPVKESETWFKEHEIQIRQAKKILILGLGAGFHIFNFEPTDEIYVLELNPELIEIFLKRNHPWKPKIHFVTPETEIDAIVFEFRPAWLGSENRYLELSRHFRCMSKTSLQKAAERKNLWVLSQALEKSQWPSEMELSVKEINQLFPLENQSEEAKIWRTLRELIL